MLYAPIVGQFIAAISPALRGLAVSCPDILEKILLDVIVDARSEQIRLLPMDDGIVVLEAAISRMDKALLIKHAKNAFFVLKGMVTTANLPAETPSKTESPKPENESSNGVEV